MTCKYWYLNVVYILVIMDSQLDDELNKEFFEMLTTAIHHKLVPNNVTEMEFNVNSESYIARSLEYWPTSRRKTCERKEVIIPPSLQGQFHFALAQKIMELRKQ